MLSKEALQHIEDNVSARKAEYLLEDSKAVLLPPNYVAQKLEKFQHNPDFFRAKIKTTSIDDFIDYVNKNASVDTGIFIDKEAMTAQAIIDMGNDEIPCWGHHRVMLTMQKTAEYKQLLSLHEKKLKQQELIDFFLDWEKHIAFYTDNNPLEFRDGIRRVRKLTVEEINKRNQEQGDLSALVEASSSFKITSHDTPIDAFLFSTPAYEGIPATQIKCSVRYYPTDKGLEITFRIIGANALQNDLAEYFKSIIDSRIEVAGIRAFIGVIEYQ